MKTKRLLLVGLVETLHAALEWAKLEAPVNRVQIESFSNSGTQQLYGRFLPTVLQCLEKLCHDTMTYRELTRDLEGITGLVVRALQLEVGIQDIHVSHEQLKEMFFSETSGTRTDRRFRSIYEMMLGFLIVEEQHANPLEVIQEIQAIIASSHPQQFFIFDEVQPKGRYSTYEEASLAYENFRALHPDKQLVIHLPQSKHNDPFRGIVRGRNLSSFSELPKS